MKQQKETEIMDQLLVTERDMTDFIREYQRMMMLYDTAIQEVELRLDVIGKEAQIQTNRNPIRSVSSRLKDPMSTLEKLKRYHLPMTMEAIYNDLHDIAGVRVICEYIADIYNVRDSLTDDGKFVLLEQKDYIENPKENGYRSLHLIIGVKVRLHSGEELVKCEVQLRTTAMDSWAGLEHNLRYKKGLDPNLDLDRGLRECADELYATDLKMQHLAAMLHTIREESASK